MKVILNCKCRNCGQRYQLDIATHKKTAERLAAVIAAFTVDPTPGEFAIQIMEALLLLDNPTITHECIESNTIGIADIVGVQVLEDYAGEMN